jgi:hypothetical protein
MHDFFWCQVTHNESSFLTQEISELPQVLALSATAFAVTSHLDSWWICSLPWVSQLWKQQAFLNQLATFLTFSWNISIPVTAYDWTDIWLHFVRLLSFLGILFFCFAVHWGGRRHSNFFFNLRLLLILFLIVILFWTLSLDLLLTLNTVRKSSIGSPASVDLSIIDWGQLGLLRSTDVYQLKATNCLEALHRQVSLLQVASCTPRSKASSVEPQQPWQVSSIAWSKSHFKWGGCMPQILGLAQRYTGAALHRDRSTANIRLLNRSYVILQRNNNHVLSSLLKMWFCWTHSSNKDFWR